MPRISAVPMLLTHVYLLPFLQCEHHIPFDALHSATLPQCGHVMGILILLPLPFYDLEIPRVRLLAGNPCTLLMRIQ